jgi:hypothetical protein
MASDVRELPDTHHHIERREILEPNAPISGKAALSNV